MSKEVVGYVTGRSQRVFDVAPAYYALVQHEFDAVFPIPSRPSVGQQARILACVQNLDVFIYEAVIAEVTVAFSTFGFLKELSFSHINHICSLRVSKGRNLLLHRLQGIIDCIQFILLKTFHAVARVSKSLRNGF